MVPSVIPGPSSDPKSMDTSFTTVQTIQPIVNMNRGSSNVQESTFITCIDNLQTQSKPWVLSSLVENSDFVQKLQPSFLRLRPCGTNVRRNSKTKTTNSVIQEKLTNGWQIVRMNPVILRVTGLTYVEDTVKINRDPDFVNGRCRIPKQD